MAAVDRLCGRAWPSCQHHCTTGCQLQAVRRLSQTSVQNHNPSILLYDHTKHAHPASQVAACIMQPDGICMPDATTAAHTSHNSCDTCDTRSCCSCCTTHQQICSQEALTAQQRNSVQKDTQLLLLQLAQILFSKSSQAVLAGVPVSDARVSVYHIHINSTQPQRLHNE